MEDKIKFMELLQEVAEIAKAQDNIITKEEIKKYFGDIKLSEEQFEHIYFYLAENKIKVQGYIFKEMINSSEQEDNQEIVEEDSKFLSMYLEEIALMEPLNTSEVIPFVQKTLDGDEIAKTKLMEGMLHTVVSIAKEYKNKGILLEDLIQEGNIGLIRGLEDLDRITKLEEGYELITSYIKQAIEQAIDEEMDAEDWENAVIAKTALLHEASNFLAEELGRIASIKELSDYTKLTIEEISDILNLSIDAVKTGSDE